MKKKILVLGATGAMGVYLIPELLNMGYMVDGVSVDDIKSDNIDLRYIKADATDIGFLSILLQNKYDGIVDFMIYPDKKKFETYMKLFLDNTKHYIYLSTYRVYAESEVISEKSPRINKITHGFFEIIIVKATSFFIFSTILFGSSCIATFAYFIA